MLRLPEQRGVGCILAPPSGSPLCRRRTPPPRFPLILPSPGTHRCLSSSTTKRSWSAASSGPLTTRATLPWWSASRTQSRSRCQAPPINKTLRGPGGPSCLPPHLTRSNVGRCRHSIRRGFSQQPSPSSAAHSPSSFQQPLVHIAASIYHWAVPPSPATARPPFFPKQPALRFTPPPPLPFPSPPRRSRSSSSTRTSA